MTQHSFTDSFPPHPSHPPMPLTSITRSPSTDSPTTSRLSLDPGVVQPTPQYATYKPRPRPIHPPRPTRSVPPIPDQTDSPIPQIASHSLSPTPLHRSQTSFESPPEHTLPVPLQEAPIQSHTEDAGKQKESEVDAPPQIHTKAVAANPIEALHASNPEELTPLRAHYLKKSLFQLQFEREVEAITTSNPHWPNVSTLSYLGPPFQPPPKDAPDVDMPFLRYMFRQFVLTFPFMASAPKNFYSQKLQPFVTSMISRNLSASSVLLDDEAEGKGEQATRKKLLLKVERNLSLFLGAATKLVENEEVVRLTQVDLDRLETLTKRRQERMKKNQDWFEINIVGVRTVIDKGRVRSRAHDVSCDHARLKLRTLTSSPCRNS